MGQTCTGKVHKHSIDVCEQRTDLLLQKLSVGGPVSSEQVERTVGRVAEPLQLLLFVSLLGSFYGPLLFCWTLMGRRGWLRPALKRQCCCTDGPHV